MSLIKCPECGREISEKAESCPNCGLPLGDIVFKEYVNVDETKDCKKCGKPYSRIEREHIATGVNGLWIFHNIGYCDKCNMKIDIDMVKNRKEYEKRQERAKENVNMIYNPISPIISNERRCPKCGSMKHHSYTENVVVRQGKVKKKTTLNLNPLKPFTVFNHKEKVVRDPVIRNVTKVICDNCGYIFS